MAGDIFFFEVLFYEIFCSFVLGCDEHGCVWFGDSYFFFDDVFDGISEEFGVVFSDSGEDGECWIWYDVGGIESSSESCFEDEEVVFLLREDEEGGGCDEFE